MEDFKTVDDFPKNVDPLIAKQKEDVANMRASLLLCSETDAEAVTTALNRITILRVYHQLSRIIRFTEMMDRIEVKLYESLNSYIDTADEYDDKTWQTLLIVQKQLQTAIIESHKILEPYLLTPSLNADNLTALNNTIDSEGSDISIDKDTRNHLRSVAKQILEELDSGESSDD